MKITNWLNSVRNSSQSTRSRRNGRPPQNAAAQVLEDRQLLSATNGGFTSDEELFASVAADFARQFNAFSQQASAISNEAASLPIIGTEIRSGLEPLLEEAFQLDVPETQIREYFESRGLTVEHVATVSDINSGANTDLLVLRYDRTIEGDEFTFNADATFGDTDGIHLGIAGGVAVQSSVALTGTFGIDHNGDIFVVEGASAVVTVTADTTGADGTLHGDAIIPGLATVTATASAIDGEHIVDAGISILLSDFDDVPNERLHLHNGSINDALNHDEAISIHGMVLVDTSLTLDSPLDHLPDAVGDALEQVGLPSSLEWSADMSIDLATGEFDYEIDDSSLDDIDEVFQNSDSLQDALFDLALDKFAEHNPIPKSAQEFLGTPIPLIEQNVLDLIDVPKAAQYIIAPAAFRDQQVSISEADDVLKFNLDFLEPSNLANFLSGESYEILSVDIEQKFEKELGAITVLPETLLFSYLGMVNATLELQVSPGFFIAVDTILGLDSDGFYIEGETATNDVDPHFAFGGSVTMTGIAEADLLYLVDFARVTVDIGLTGFGDVTLVSPNGSDAKLRPSDITSKNMAVGLGVDLDLGLKGEVGFVEFDQFDADVERDTTIEVYRSKEGTRLSDIEKRLVEFKDELETEGQKTLFAAAAVTGNPLLVATSAYVLYQGNSSIAKTARAMVGHGIDVVDTAIALRNELGASLTTVAKTMHREMGAGLGTIAKTLTREFGVPVSRSVSILHNELNATFKELLPVLRRTLKIGVDDAARILRDLGASPKDIAILLTNDGIGIKRLTHTLKYSLTLGHKDLADTLYRGVTKDLSKIAGAMRHRGVSVTKIADAFNNKLKVSPRSTAKALYHGATKSLRTIAGAMSKARIPVAKIADAFDDGLRVHHRLLADALYNGGVTKNLKTIAKYMRAEGISVRNIADAFDDKLKINYRDIGYAIGKAGFKTSPREIAKVLKLEGATAKEVSSSLKKLKVSSSKIQDALKNGAKFASSQIKGALKSVGIKLPRISSRWW